LVILGFGEDGHFIALLLTKKSQKEIAESHAMLLWIKWPFLGPLRWILLKMETSIKSPSSVIGQITVHQWI
jgi:hypothetical protein